MRLSGRTRPSSKCARTGPSPKCAAICPSVTTATKSFPQLARSVTSSC
nr:MAG TPA: hypothetical protein [Caudoviricetes sp.]